MEAFALTLPLILLAAIAVGLVMAVVEYEHRGEFYLATALLAVAISVVMFVLGDGSAGTAAIVSAALLAVNWRIAKI